MLVLITCPSKEVAEEIARALLKERLAACVNITGSLLSLFWWKGRIDQAEEALMLVKTRASLLEQLIAKVRELHPYEVPEVIALPITSGSEAYLAWLGEETRSGA